MRMNERNGIRKEFEIQEPWPPSKILWMPKPETVFRNEVDGDLLATSSDILRLYPLKRDTIDGPYQVTQDPI